MTLHVSISRSNLPVIDCGVIEVAHLHAALVARDAEIAALTRRLDDFLDRESMHALDAGRERLTTAAVLDRFGLPWATHTSVTTVAEQRARRRGPVAGAFGSPAIKEATPSQHIPFPDTRLAENSRVRGQGSARTAPETSAAAVRATPPRIHAHQTRRIVLRVLELAAADAGAWAKRWLILISAPLLLWITKCSAPPSNPTARGGAR